jgi:hypothetical protein
MSIKIGKRVEGVRRKELGIGIWELDEVGN